MNNFKPFKLKEFETINKIKFVCYFKNTNKERIEVKFNISKLTISLFVGDRLAVEGYQMAIYDYG